MTVILNYQKLMEIEDTAIKNAKTFEEVNETIKALSRVLAQSSSKTLNEINEQLKGVKLDFNNARDSFKYIHDSTREYRQSQQNLFATSSICSQNAYGSSNGDIKVSIEQLYSMYDTIKNSNKNIARIRLEEYMYVGYDNPHAKEEDYISNAYNIALIG